MDNILKHFLHLSAVQQQQLAALGALYHNWNAKINVISRKDIDLLYPNHILHSLAIAKYIEFSAQDRVLDAGTGGGMPGIPLAILFPDTQFVLVDSTRKKLQVVDAIAAELGLSNVQTEHIRLEEIHDQYDYVVSRAVTRLDVMWGWVHQRIRQSSQNKVPNGLLYLKGGDISGELPNNCRVQKIPLQSLINEPQFVEKALVHICKK